MHHGTNADGLYLLNDCPVILLNIFKKLCISSLHRILNVIHAIGPYAIFKLIFPLVGTLCDNISIAVDHDSLNFSRAKLHTDYGTALFNYLLNIHKNPFFQLQTCCRNTINFLI